jgi:hypothetical protein
LVVVALVMGVLGAPAAADPVAKTEFTRTECVFVAGAPDVNRFTGEDGKIWHVRDLPYFGALSGGGVNTGLVAIDLNQQTGSGSIRGTLTVRDEIMGDFDGRFSGHYKDFVWQGRGSATGVGDDAGRLLKVRLQGLDPGATCGADAIDAAHWDIVIFDH